MKIFVVVLSLLLYLPSALGEVSVGSKKFTESVILGEIVSGLLNSSGIATDHRQELGGTRVLWNALLRGDIQLYPDYSGTIRHEILAEQKIPPGEDQLRWTLAEKGLGMIGPLGFNNTYALGMLEPRAKQLQITTISDLTKHPQLHFGFSSEFVDRVDGWPGLKSRYGLPQTPRGLDHDLAYRGLAAGSLDVTVLYSTDAEIQHYQLRVLGDDRNYFPRYDAVLLYRLDLPKPVQQKLQALAGRIDEARMIAMNAEVKLKGSSEQETANRFLQEQFAVTHSQQEQGLLSRMMERTGEHLSLVAISLTLAIATALPLGILAARRQRFGQAVLAVTGILQTMPALALLVFMIPLLGIGATPAIAALFLYSLLPIVRNTHAGLTGISPALRESAEALGLSYRFRLWRIELPLALPSILAGIKTAAVINIGTATLGALIGAGGYGQPILTGIRLDDTALILEGALPAAALALVTQGVLEWLERKLVPHAASQK